jgi:MFS family permease
MVAAEAKADFGSVVVSSGERSRVIFASTLGTVFEWYDFYLYVVLAPAFAKLFFPPANDNAALLAAFATYGAGYVIRPLGAIVFGRMGDSTGRKYTFLTTIVLMGLSTFCVGLLPTYTEIGWLAPALLVFLRLVQGLAMGGEYGGAAVYVAEYSEPGRRGLSTSWIQATYVVGLILGLGVLLICRSILGPDVFTSWGWRIPFLASFILLIISVYVRVKLRETPIFQRLKAEGKETKAPVAESFRPVNSLAMILAVFGAVGGAAAVTITANFYTLFFLSTTMQVDLDTTYAILIPVLAVSILTYVLFGWLSDKIGRLKIMLTGSLFASLTFIPLFHVLAVAVNPDLVRFQQETPVSVTVDERTCGLHVFIGPWTQYSTCDQVGDILTKSGVNFTKVNAPGARNVVVSVGGQTADVSGTDRPAITQTLQSALFAAGYPGLRPTRANGEPQTGSDGPAFERNPADKTQIKYVLAGAAIFILLAYGAMMHAPLGAFLVELFPARIRYVSMSFPYQIGYGWVGGNVPLVATAIVVMTGDIYSGLWYPVAVTAISVLIGALFLRDTSKLSLYR